MRAIFPPGETYKAHIHADMWEMFIVEEGELFFKVNSRRIKVSMGDSILIFPSELHEVTNNTTQHSVVTVISWIS